MTCGRQRAGGLRVAPAWILIGLGIASAAAAQDQFIEDVQVSRSGDVATIEIRLGCPMRFVADSPTAEGVLIEARMAPFDECRAIGNGILNELHRPVGGRLAGLSEIEYDSLGIGDGMLLLHFDRPVAIELSQRGDLRTLEIRVREADGAPTPPVTRSLEPVETPSAAPAAAPPRASADSGRVPLRSRVVEPAVTADYMLNLLSTRDRSTIEPLPAVPLANGQHLYVSRIVVDGTTWYRLRLGFFGSEADAATVLETLRARFPRAWIGRAEPAEIEYATQFQPGRQAPVAEFVAEAPPAATAVDQTAAPLPPERVTELLEAGRAAMLDSDLPAAIAAYTELVTAPGDHDPQAREFLGLAYERSGDFARARAEYERYLEEYPDSDGVPRVRQRIAGLSLRAAEPAAPLRETEVPEEARWDFSAGIAQYFRRDVNQFDEDQPKRTTLSALFNDVDVRAERRGDRLDFSTRFAFSYMNDLLDPADGGRGDQQRTTYAYADVGATDGRWSTRLGRQTLHTFGVLGRFDGAHVAYDFGNDRALHFTAGYPVESTLDPVETDRQFYGLAYDLGRIIGDWDFTAFYNTQTIGSIAARSAVGTDVRYFDNRRSFSGTVDYDVDYKVLNTLLMLGTWRFENRLTLSVLYDERKSPILTTRNALIGQPVASIDELLLVWTEDEIRQLAIDRTADSRTVTLGIATPLADRFQLNFDLTRTEFGGTVASAGVAAVPDQGVQTFVSTSLVGTGLFRGGDVNIFNIRFGDSERFRTGYLTWDARFPIGRRVRLNPRIQYVVWQGLLDGRERRTVSPMLRLLVNMHNRYRIELEVGTDRQVLDDPALQTTSTGSYVNIGYRAGF